MSVAVIGILGVLGLLALIASALTLLAHTGAAEQWNRARIERLPGLRFAPDQGPLRYTESMIVPSLRSLRVSWDVRAKSAVQ